MTTTLMIEFAVVAMSSSSRFVSLSSGSDLPGFQLGCATCNCECEESRIAVLMVPDLTCEASVSFCYDPTGPQDAQECGAASFACVDCGGSAGCPDHAHRCFRCDET